MKTAWTPERLLETVGSLCNGTLGDDQGRQLDELLRDDPGARRVYTDYMWMHASLYSENGSLTGLSHPEILPLKGPPRAALMRSARTFTMARRIGSAARSWRGWAAAAALAGVAFLSSWGSSALRSGSPGGPLAATDESAPVAAQITGTHNCRWRHPESGVDYGSRLRVGQVVELDEGLAEITFANGATVLLEGPATMAVDSADKLGLASGRLAAVVPQRAAGFRVHTASLDVFEAGSEFGLWAQESGAAEVHVFNGLVRADVRDANGQALRRLELNAAEAARISPLSTTVVEFPADDAKFVRNILPSSGPHDGLLAYDGFRYPEGPLEAQNGGFGWAGPWFTTSADQEGGPDSNRVKAGSLAVGGLAPVGNRAQLAGHYNRIRRQLATSVGGVFDAAGLVENRDEVRLVGGDGKQVYISFMQRVSRRDDGFYGVEFHRGDGNANRVLCIGNGADGAGYGATSNVNIYGERNFPALGEETTDANLFVVKITFGVENRDVAEVYRNPESLRDEQACKADAVLRGNFAFDRISLANFDGTKLHEVDEIRVGTHFLAVTGRWGNDQSRTLRQLTDARRPRGPAGSTGVRRQQHDLPGTPVWAWEPRRPGAALRR
ncbi:MAG TPA: hypothetical protein VEQ85_08835, partial [Lacipirellulaceae bacterium]|nr:hypothetical protein [Lacipirellulaceae bacterium]